MADDLRSPEPWPPGRVLVLTATYDERDNIGPLVDALLAVDPAFQVLVVDDDSPDRTGRLVLEQAEREPRLHVLVRRGRRGLGSAILEGLEVARRHGFEIVVNLDADFSHDPADLPRLPPRHGRPRARGAGCVARGAVSIRPASMRPMIRGKSRDSALRLARIDSSRRCMIAACEKRSSACVIPT